MELPDKSLFTDIGGRYKTQSLFLEIAYNPEAVYTLKEQDHTWEGKLYPSLKRLYVEREDPTEYEFATEYLANWRHWQKLLENKVLRRHIDEWRDELEWRLRSKAARQMLREAEKGNYQASKWFMDRGWMNRPAGRPSKAEIEKERVVQAQLGNEFGADVHRLFGAQK